MPQERVIENVILASIASDEYEGLLPALQSVTLPLGARLYKSGDDIEHVYFPGGALVSLVTHMKDGAAIEVGVIGKDGIVGIPVLLGDDIACEEAVVQVAGSAMRMRSAVLKQTVQRRHSSLLSLLLLYTRALMKQVVQTAACNRHHNETERLSRWLLMCRDRMESDELLLSQDFVSDILGIRRASVTNAASNLQGEGLIRYSPGSIKILNRKRLEEYACDCYRLVAVNAEKSAVMIDTTFIQAAPA